MTLPNREPGALRSEAARAADADAYWAVIVEAAGAAGTSAAPIGG